MIMISLLLLLLSFSTTTIAASNNVAAAASIEPDGTIHTSGNDDQDKNQNDKYDKYLSKVIASLPTDKFYINGTWVATSTSDNPSFFDVVDPSTASVVAKVALGHPDDVDAAVRVAKEAQLSWSYHTTREERQRLVQNLIQVYSFRMEDMAQLISTEMGSPIVAARSSHVKGGLGNIKSALNMMVNHFEFERPLPNIHPERGQEQHTTILYEPIGVVGMISPWNWPLNQITLVSASIVL
jgi:acyl-CoA reductase-like NAD-dependent aldehyde dehydrogenase